MKATIESRVVPSVEPDERSPAAITREFRGLLDAGVRIEAAGSARRRPGRLLTLGYVPRARLDLFDATYYLTAPRQNEDIRFFVAYLQLGAGTAHGRRMHARLFYKDISLTWRSASHYARSADENWIGKGDVKTVVIDGQECIESDECTTDLPLEIQSALETLVRRARRIPHDDRAVGLVLRRGPDDRVEPFRDFTGPRRRAAANPANLVNRGRPIARFARKNDPTSLRFVPGFEPDFTRGVVEENELRSRIYGGRLRRFRIVSKNRKAQFMFLAGPRHVWIASCQATTTELSTYGVRTIDAVVPDDLLLPGFEYHFVDESLDPPALYSQIPPGFAGRVSDHDDSRVDASAFLEKMPVVRDFRRKVLGPRRRRR